MSEIAEMHLLQNRLKDLESAVTSIAVGLTKKEMKLRDEFAMAALTGMLSASIERPWPCKAMANNAYAFADAMLEAREVKNGQG